MSRVYAGIGSRETPIAVCETMALVGRDLSEAGWVLRSGGAQGADESFEAGADFHGAKEIFLPWPGFNGSFSKLTRPTPDAFELASRFHPAWPRLSRGPRALHARNCHIVLGADLKSPVEFVLCWTPGGKGGGGTGQALRVAKAYDISIIDMAYSGWKDRLDQLLEGMQP